MESILILSLLFFSIIEKIFDFQGFGTYFKLVVLFLFFIINLENIFNKLSAILILILSIFTLVVVVHNGFESNQFIYYLYFENILLILFCVKFCRVDIYNADWLIKGFLKVLMVFSVVKILIFIIGTFGFLNFESLYARVGRTPVDLDFLNLSITGFHFGPEYIFVIAFLIYDRIYSNSKHLISPKYIYALSVLITFSRFYVMVVLCSVILFSKTNYKIKALFFILAIFLFQFLSEAREIGDSDGRFIQWVTAWNILQENLLLGSPGKLMAISDFGGYTGSIECESCMILTESGLVGLICFIFVPIIALKNYYRNVSLGFFSSCAGVIFFAGFFNPVYTTISYAITLFFVFQASRISEAEKIK